MSGITKLGADPERVTYRLSETCGSDSARVGDVVVDYRLEGARGIERVGSGWAEFGRQAGTTLDSAAEIQEVRDIMAGRDPHTGATLVQPKVAVHPLGRVPARPLVDALFAVAEQARRTPAQLLGSEGLCERLARLERMILKKGESHRAPVGDLEPLAQAAGIALEEVYEVEELATARRHADERVPVGNQGFDWTLTLPRRLGAWWGLLPMPVVERMDELFAQAVRQGLGWLEEICAYGMAGQHGRNGNRAQKVDTSGWAATITWHRTTRPIDGGPGDPHPHAHVMISNLVWCSDNKWRTTAAGGRELYRHVGAASDLVLALYRWSLTREYGIRWEYNSATKQWDVAGMPDELRHLFSRRSQQINAVVGAGASNAERRAAGRATAEAKVETTPAQERASWRRRAMEAGWVPEHVTRAVLGYEPPSSGLGPSGVRPPNRPDPGEVAAAVWDPETGATFADKSISRAQLMRHVAAACGEGLENPDELEELTKAAEADEQAVPLPNDRITATRIVDAEHAITDAARQRRGEGAAVVSGGTAEAAMAAFAGDRGYLLSHEQERVVRRLLGAGHGIEAVIGVSGSGKTTVMDAARRGWETAGMTVKGACTAAKAAANLRAASKIGSVTVASWQHRIAHGEGLEGVDVLIVDEAAMVDDRALAELVQEAERTGTKLVSIGDPKQLRAVGVGGAFARVHEIVDGLVLAENRRQRDAVERSALQVWRQGERATTLAVWGRTGHVHATADLHEAYAHMVAAWWGDWSGHVDPHEGIEQALLLAATNRDVEELNLRARVIARAEGHLSGPDVDFALPGGQRLELAAGEVVRVRRNDYRSHLGEEDVYNGYSGIVRQVDARRGALIEWRQAAHTSQAWISPEQIAAGGVSHGYALTIAASQGQTSATCHVLGLGADAHALYPAMTRVTQHSTLYLPAAELESDEVRDALGEARTDRERLDRVIDAYARTLTDEDEGMVTDVLDGVRRDDGPTPQPAAAALTVQQARAGKGPTMAEAAPRLQELDAEAEQAQRRVQELHTRLVEQAAQPRPRLWRRAADERLEQVHTDLDQARTEHQRVLAEAQRLREQAVAADVVIAQRGPLRPNTPPERGGHLAPTGPRPQHRPEPAQPAHRTGSSPRPRP